jgi:hypothetical protein
MSNQLCGLCDRPMVLPEICDDCYGQEPETTSLGPGLLAAANVAEEFAAEHFADARRGHPTAEYGGHRLRDLADKLRRLAKGGGG